MPHGRLRLSLPESYGSGRRSNWNEGSRGALDTKLESVLGEITERIEAERQRVEEWAPARVLREQEAAERAERERLQRIEQPRPERLFAEAGGWRQADEARAYLAALRARLEPGVPGARPGTSASTRWRLPGAPASPAPR